VTGLDAPTDYGTTHLLASGDETAPVVLLLPGGSATATAWSAVAGGLSRDHRVVAVDPVGQPGLSTPGQRPLKTAADLASWLDQVLDYLGAQRAALAPARVSHLMLLDPDWLAVATAGADLGRSQIVLPAVPKPAELAGLAVPALVVVAARSRAHDPAQIAARARERLPEVTVETLAQATHHTIPTEDADELAGSIAGFLASGYAR
jgi:pimeloyl-ACP methyl ester carboxylesterase